MFLLLVDNSEVYIVSLDVPHPVNVRIPLVGTDIVSGITWDSRTDTIYFVDSGHRTISSAKITVSHCWSLCRYCVCVCACCTSICYSGTSK